MVNALFLIKVHLVLQTQVIRDKYYKYNIKGLKSKVAESNQ